jgi:hypothetical protein
MKKIITLILLLCMILSLSACGKVEITIQEINDANQTDVLLKNHQSVYIRDEMDGENLGEVYLSKDYVFNYMPGVESDWMEFLTDDARYSLAGDDYVYYVFITPDGVGDFTSKRAEHSASAALCADAEGEIIESVSKKDGRITVKTFLPEDVLAAKQEDFGGLISSKSEFVLDAKNHEIISFTNEFTYDDGSAIQVISEVTYDAEAPELLKTILAYENQVENLRNVTIISNPGTEKEERKSIQVPKGLIVGLEFDDAVASAVEFYTDAACTESYDPYAGTDSDLTIYVKWNNT